MEARTVRKRKRKGAIIRQRDLVLADIRIIIHVNYKTFKNKLIYYVRNSEVHEFWKLILNRYKPRGD